MKHGPKVWPEEQPFGGSVGALSGLGLSAVAEKKTSRSWSGLIDRYLYLVYSLLPMGQSRYLIEWEQRLLGTRASWAAAWKVASRDR